MEDSKAGVPPTRAWWFYLVLWLASFAMPAIAIEAAFSTGVALWIVQLSWDLLLPWALGTMAIAGYYVWQAAEPPATVSR